MNQYAEDFNIFESNIEAINKDEPVYKNYIREILIESFNISYSNKIKLFITNEISDTINILISDKINIFIDHFLNKLNNDYDYYYLLFKKMDELGDNNKASIINLFSNIPKKLNESIYNLIEEEIFYYIDIFFRENKNIFTNNFIKFYLNNSYLFNLSMYRIEDYLKDFLLDNNFNKTLNNITSYPINEIQKEIKTIIKQTILTKINSFNTECNLIYEQIIIELNKIKASPLTNEMKTLIQLLNNHATLIENQNNKYLFSVGENPFDILNIFIAQELEPPLSLILEKYQLIEKELVNRITPIAENFPDCYSEVKKNLLGTKLEEIDDIKIQINENIIDYQNILIDEIQGYLNKLIHFTYIEGLQTIDKPCEESYCSFPKSAFRRLNKREIIDISKVYKHHPNLVNISKIKNKLNKKINLINKRKTSSFPEYTSDMGALSESDVTYYLSNLQNTIMNLNKLYLGKEYLNINLTTNKFLTKINVTFLEKLKDSFEIKIAKFSTILREESINNIRNTILKQYYDIEKYVYNSSYLLLNKMNYFLNELNINADIIESLSGYIHNQALGYYNILYSSIQSKYINLDLQPPSIIAKLFPNLVNETKVTIFGVVSDLQTKIKLEFNLTHILKGCLGKTTLGKLMKKMDDFSKFQIELKEEIPIIFPPFPNFQIRITPELSGGLGFYASVEPNWEELKFNLAFDVYIEAYLSVKFEGGFYIPCSTKSPISSAFAVGLDGVIGHGRAGIKLEIYIFEFDINFDLYFIGKAFVFEFYCQVKAEAKFKILKFESSHDFYRVKLFGIETELHTSQKVPKKYDGGKNFPIFFGSPGHND